MNKILIFLSALFATLLIIIGSFLEIYFYYYRFDGDGLPVWLSIIIGCGLTLFLNTAVVFRNKTWSKISIILLAIYSITTTSAGQAFSLDIKINIENQISIDNENIDNQISIIQNEIDRLKDLSKPIENRLNIDSIETRAYWRTNVNQDEETLQKYNDRIFELNNELLKLVSVDKINNATIEKNTTIYSFYAGLFNLDKTGEKWLQVIYQTFLSILIASMAPVGIMAFPKKEDKEILKDESNIVEHVETTIKEPVENNDIEISDNDKKLKIISDIIDGLFYQTTLTGPLNSPIFISKEFNIPKKNIELVIKRGIALNLFRYGNNKNLYANENAYDCLTVFTNDLKKAI